MYFIYKLINYTLPPHKIKINHVDFTAHDKQIDTRSVYVV